MTCSSDMRRDDSPEVSLARVTLRLFRLTREETRGALCENFLSCFSFFILSRGEENKKQTRSNSVRGLLPEPRSIGIVDEKERHRSCSRCSPDARGRSKALATGYNTGHAELLAQGWRLSCSWAGVKASLCLGASSRFNSWDDTGILHPSHPISSKAIIHCDKWV